MKDNYRFSHINTQVYQKNYSLYKKAHFDGSPEDIQDASFNLPEYIPHKQTLLVVMLYNAALLNEKLNFVGK